MNTNHAGILFLCFISACIPLHAREKLAAAQIGSQDPVLEVASGKEIVIRDTCDWTRPGAPRPFRDTRRIVISAPSPTLRQIDFDITLDATEEAVVRETNHSLFSSRMDPDLTPVHGGTMINAEGAKGENPRLWYRVLGFSGAPETAGIGAIFSEFSASKPEALDQSMHRQSN